MKLPALALALSVAVARAGWEFDEHEQGVALERDLMREVLGLRET